MNSVNAAPAKIAISLEEIRFTSGVYIDDNGTFHLAEHPGLPQYVGPPSSEIDEAWEEIVQRRHCLAPFMPSQMTHILIHSSGMVLCDRRRDQTVWRGSSHKENLEK